MVKKLLQEQMIQYLMGTTIAEYMIMVLWGTDIQDGQMNNHLCLFTEEWHGSTGLIILWVLNKL